MIPASMTKEILEKLHAAHQGTEKMKLRARSAIFWNGINKNIDQTASHCTECQEAQPRQTREELEPTDIPPYTWHTVGADLFFLDNPDYRIVADYYSKYLFVYKLPSTESPTISRCLKSLFAEQGVPVILRSDNGPQFSSNGFRKFADEYGFRHVTSSPHYPRSNGFTESQVKIVKKSLAKAKKSGLDPALALLCLRTMPTMESRSHQRNYCSDGSFRTTFHVVVRETPVKQTISNISLRSKNNRRPTMTSVHALHH